MPPRARSIRPRASMIGAKKFTWNTVIQSRWSRLQAAQPAASLALRRDRRVVDERVQPAALRFQPLLHHGDGRKGVVGIGEIDLDVVLGACLPGAVLREAVARAGDHAPAGRGEALHRGVADAAAGAGQDQRLPLFIRDLRHARQNRPLPPLRIEPRLDERRAGVRRAGTRSGRAAGAGRLCQNSISSGTTR